jgi:hypothetical protein
MHSLTESVTDYLTIHPFFTIWVIPTKFEVFHDNCTTVLLELMDDESVSVI